MRRGALAAAVAGLVLVAALAAMVDRFGQRDFAGPADVIVILGSQVERDGRPGTSLRVRVEHAVALYRKGFAPLLLASGGRGLYPPAEAVSACAHAVSLGVPAHACLAEDGSHNTRENARNTAAMLRSRRLERVLVVSDPYHLLRARQHFRRHGIEVRTSPVLFCERNVRIFQRIFWTLREVAALLASPSLLFAQAPADGQGRSGPAAR